MDIFVPDQLECQEALSRTTHLGIGAHADDLEFMALHGIEACFESNEHWFGGITITNGAGSARNGPYESFSNAEMINVRAEEQRQAAKIGQYSFVAQLAQRSDNVENEIVEQQLIELILKSRPEVVYTHNPFDKHLTHRKVFRLVVSALRKIDISKRPRLLYGCEVWRSLDWLPEELKVIHPLDRFPELGNKLNAVFKSQILGGKNYDLAVDGRRRANATFLDAKNVDDFERAQYSIDLSPLIREEPISTEGFIREVLQKSNQSLLKVINE